MRVALCQIEVVSGDREGNFQRITNAVKDAKSKAADLAVLPESCILGWINPDAFELAHPIPGADTARLAELARSFQMAIIVGVDEKCGTQLYDSAVAISSEGDLLAVHRKANVLPQLMDPPYSCGDGQVTVAEFPFGRVGVLICADTFMEESIESARLAGLDLLVVPYGWVAEDVSWPRHGERLEALICKNAQRLGCPVIGVDALGQVEHGRWAGRRYCGGSMAASPDGRALFQLQLAAPHVTVVDLDLRKL